MNTAAMELLDRAKALAKSDRNLDMIDRVTLVHGYLGLSELHPEDASFRRDLDNAVSGLLEAARWNDHWRALLEPDEARSHAA